MAVSPDMNERERAEFLDFRTLLTQLEAQIAIEFSRSLLYVSGVALPFSFGLLDVVKV